VGSKKQFDDSLF
jgi:hypothetical protein